MGRAGGGLLTIAAICLAFSSAADAQQPGPRQAQRVVQPGPPGAQTAQPGGASTLRRIPMPGPHGQVPGAHGPGAAQRNPATKAPPHPLSAEAAEEAEKEGHHADPNGPPKPINFFYGFLGKKEGVEPSILWRRPDQDAPFLAALFNFAVFIWIIVRFGRKPVQDSLTKRKEGILRDIEAAQKMRGDAEKRLNEYEDKLTHIDSEIERIRTEFREQGERDKERIVREAVEKRERMLKDAAFLIEQEVKQMRIVLLHETVEAAVRDAEKILRSRITTGDQERLSEEFLEQLAASTGTTPTKGGRA